MQSVRVRGRVRFDKSQMRVAVIYSCTINTFKTTREFRDSFAKSFNDVVSICVLNSWLVSPNDEALPRFGLIHPHGYCKISQTKILEPIGLRLDNAFITNSFAFEREPTSCWREIAKRGRTGFERTRDVHTGTDEEFKDI